MKKVYVPSSPIVVEYFTWIKATAGNACNLSFTRMKEEFETTDNYTIGWITKNKRIMFVFKNDCDATAFKIRFGI
jgi:hypothetical protein